MLKKNFILFFILIILILLQYVNCGIGKKNMLIGVALGATIARTHNHDLKLLHILIPLRLAAEAWKQLGKHQLNHNNNNYYYKNDPYHNGVGYNYYRHRRR